jgi:hypothetical protein
MPERVFANRNYKRPQYYNYPECCQDIWEKQLGNGISQEGHDNITVNSGIVDWQRNLTGYERINSNFMLIHKLCILNQYFAVFMCSVSLLH